MKITAVFLLAAALTAGARGHSQTVTLKEKEASLEKIFRSIHRQTGFQFIYNDETMKAAKPVSIDVSNAPLNDVLQLCFKDQPLEWNFQNNAIVIKQKPIPPVAVPVLNQAPDNAGAGLQPVPIEISGKVTNTSGEPLPGASISVKGKANLGAKTDANGVFILKGLEKDDVLIFSYTGYTTQNVKVGNTTGFLIKLEINDSPLDQIIIKAYGTDTKRFTTGNIATVKAADIEKQPVQNPLLALQGRVPGLEITQLTGLNGGGIKIRIQGRNSINSGLDPLVVIDGVPFPAQLAGAGLENFFVQGGSPLNFINPADIESIDILKDADATAIYGSRAANGAILITTKKGKAGKSTVSVGMQQGWGKVTRTVDMLDRRQYLDMRYEAYRNDGIDWTDPSVSANDLKLWDTTRSTNWQKELIGGTAKYTNVNATVSGGTAAIQYLVGATYNRQTTVFPGDFDDKAGTLNFNLSSVSANQRLKMQLSGNYRYDQNRMPGIDLTQTALLMEPVAPFLYNKDGTLNWAPDAAGNSTWTNPLSYTQSSEFSNTTKNLVSNLNLGYRIIPGLELRTSLGYTNLLSQLYNPSRLESFAPEARPFSQRTAFFGNRSMSSWIVEPMLQYTGRIGKGKLDALLGSTIQKSSFTYLGIYSSGFDADILMNTMTAARSNFIYSSTSGIARYNALFGRLNYNWADKYLLSLTARRDGSNKFGDKNKFNNFGSVGLGWIISEEKWVKQSLNFLSFAKIRTSYGITGNDQIADFSYLSVYGIQNPGILYQNSISLNATNIPNPYLQWERTSKWQSGLDLGILQDRILLGIAYARNRSSNQLVSYLLPSYNGFQTIVKNLPAIIQNTSWEFTVNTVNVKTRHFSWTTSANLTIPRNKLISFPGIELTSYADGTQGVVVGQPLGVSKVHQYAGLNPANGQYLGLDKNGNPNYEILNPNTFVSALTNWYGGIINTIGFKGFQLEFLIQVVRKRDARDFIWYNGTLYPGQFYGGYSNQPVSVLSRWQKPGDNKLLPPFSTTTISSSVTISDAWYSLDASYVRVKNVSLSWQVPVIWAQKMKIQSAKLYAHAQNLATITKYAGMDPESGATGLPPLRMITTGINIEF